MSGDREVIDKVKKVLSELEETKSKELEEALTEAFGEDHYHIQSNKQKKIDNLKEQLAIKEEIIKELNKEIEDKEQKIKELKDIDKFNDLEEIKDIDVLKKRFASQEEIENLANDFMFLAKEIKDNQYLLTNTLKIFDYYRKMITSRNEKEKGHFETQMWLKDK